MSAQNISYVFFPIFSMIVVDRIATTSGARCLK